MRDFRQNESYEVKGFMKEKKKMNLGVKILLGMVLGIVVGAILWLAL